MNKLNLRLMTKFDFNAVRLVWKESGIELSFSDSDNELHCMLERNPRYCFVLENGNNIIGGVLGGFDGRRGWIHHLAIHPDYQQKGYGKMLLDKLISVFEEDKIVKLKLEILESNKEVINFYKHLGWDMRPELTTMSLNLPRDH